MIILSQRIPSMMQVLRFRLLVSAAILFLLSQTSILPEVAQGQDLYLVVLGNAQDAGYPQSNCKKPCCEAAWDDPSVRRFPTCVAVVDKKARTKTLFECTPHFPDQIHRLDKLENGDVADYRLNGIYLTHAHIGHYAGLIHLGREVEGAKGIPVHVMPRMRDFLIKNGPWSQLVELGNVSLRRLTAGISTQTGRLEITPLLVPHRDEFSETVGFRIKGPKRSILFLPDIDKWEKWKEKIEAQVKLVDYALLDGTFFDGNELPGRDMSKIPHPFVIESMRRFEKLPAQEKSKIRFIHLNHTNPLLRKKAKENRKLTDAGFGVAEQGQVFPL